MEKSDWIGLFSVRKPKKNLNSMVAFIQTFKQIKPHNGRPIPINFTRNLWQIEHNLKIFIHASLLL